MLCKYNCLPRMQVGQRICSSILHWPWRGSKEPVKSKEGNRRRTEAQLGQEHPENSCHMHQSLALMKEGSWGDHHHLESPLHGWNPWLGLAQKKERRSSLWRDLPIWICGHWSCRPNAAARMQSDTHLEGAGLTLAFLQGYGYTGSVILNWWAGGKRLLSFFMQNHQSRIRIWKACLVRKTGCASLAFNIP